jgi:two-component system sensor histidine kinase PilS (NtrC family)
MTAKRQDIFWFIILRLIVITSLVISAVIIQYGTSTFLQINALYGLVIGAYLLSALYLVLYYWGKYFSFQAYLQIFFDLVLITALVYISGGLKGSFYFLYIFEIIAASIVLSNRAAYVTAAFSSVFFGFLVDGMFLGLIPYFDNNVTTPISLRFVIGQIFVSWGVFFLVAFLINYLTHNLRNARHQLDLARKELDIKKNLALAGEFSAQLAHEIRNPLAAISGSVQVLHEDLELTGEQKKLMDIVVDESHRISLSIDQFLNLAAPGKHILSWFDLSEELTATIILLQRSGVLTEKHRVEGNYDSAPMQYYGNRNQFKQIFWNIIKNGIKAMPDGGVFTIDFEGGGKEATILKFSDSGLGMESEAKERLFEPFFSGFESGLGIGMAVVYRIVSDYKGKILVDSAPGRGTTIKIILPKKKDTKLEAKGERRVSVG